MPPLWSGFPDFGPDPDFFEKSGPDLLSKSVFLALGIENHQVHVILARDDDQLARLTIIL